MIAKAKSIAHGGVSIDYITRLGRADIVKLNFLPSDIEAQVYWQHMKVHQLMHLSSSKSGRPLKNNLIRIEISPTLEESRGWSMADWARLVEDFVQVFDAVEFENSRKARRTNVAGSQYLATLHRDSKSGIPHIHLDVNRVDMDGHINDDHYIGLRAVMAANQIALQRGWETAFERSNKNRNQISEDCIAALKKMKHFSWEEYCKLLRAKGYDVHLILDRSGDVRGYTIKSGNSIYKSSELGPARRLTPSRIMQTWSRYHGGPMNHRTFASNELNSKQMQNTSMYGNLQKEQAQSSPGASSVNSKVTTIQAYIPVNDEYYTIHITETQYDLLEREIAPHLNSLDKENGIALTRVALLLMCNYINGATTLAASHGGGGSAPSSNWGRDPREDDLEWIRRCIRAAKALMESSRRRGMRR